MEWLWLPLTTAAPSLSFAHPRKYNCFEAIVHTCACYSIASVSIMTRADVRPFRVVARGVYMTFIRFQSAFVYICNSNKLRLSEAMIFAVMDAILTIA